MLFLAFLLLAFVFPGLKQGIDLQGGTQIIVRADTPLDPSVIEPVFKEKYSLTELQISSVQGANGYGLFIQFSENTDLSNAESLYDQAEASLATNPEQAKNLASQSLEYSSKFSSEFADILSLSAEDAVEVAHNNLVSAQEAFQLDLQNTIKSTYSLGDELRFQKKEIRPSLGESFFSLGLSATILGVILVVIVIFISFREFIPSVAIVSAMIFDIVGALAGMAIFQIPLSLATIPALLMMIGYSVDTDILLTTRVMKRRDGTARERASEATITGLTMTSATLAALVVMLVLSYFSQLQVIYDIASVLLFGLFADLFSTWLMNAPILLWYKEKKDGVSQ